jgi:hypothetical protein
MADGIKLTPAISLPENFRITEVDPQSKPGATPADPAHRTPSVVASAIPSPALGPLAAFVGNWQGRGFNTIFRPNSSKTPTKLPSGLAVGDNVLELNLTEETLSFSTPLGSVPNRGSATQADAFLNGVPYLQAIKDITDPTNVTGIHLEPGMWVIVPPTTNPAETGSVARMASIPHGTTINAQGTFSTVAGPPQIAPVGITPTTIAGNAPVRFPSQTASNAGTQRIPQDLTKAIATETITQAMLDDPNVVLRNAITHQTITSTTVIVISTRPPAPLVDGGITDIAFLGPNARALEMSATFWIETVEHTINVPVHTPGNPVHVQPKVPAGQFAPTFEFVPPPGIPIGHPIKVRSTQIQYSQTVILDFAGLHWPHVSVATLVPATAIPTPVVWP